MGRLALVFAFGALLVGCSGEKPPEVVTIALAEQSGSTQSGDAVLTAVGDDRTRVELSIGRGGEEPQPARIYRGSCERLEPAPAYVLEDVAGGESLTEIEVSLDELLDGDLVINVHLSAGVMRVQVVCGKIAA
jgi:hypothetical protein